MQKQSSPSRVMMFLIPLICVIFTATTFAQSPRRRPARTRNMPTQNTAIRTPLQSSTIENAIRGVLEKQVAAWNRADIEGFMDGYHRSADIVFVSGDTVTRGWATVLERYQRTYDTKEKMGTLAFTDLEIKPLDTNHATALGRWQLTRTGEAAPFAKGRFTLIFLRTPQGWRIMHDHTSSAGN
ncbi:MAG: nuclear transport factor 2 family protein [Pyrinomonadaceae bacterium MAG19_C2-C3]|nr:nuclear transport factor 2 family protein [Pyrinomonadaceae bacterium MAG19_C2-C3]